MYPSIHPLIPYYHPSDNRITLKNLLMNFCKRFMILFKYKEAFDKGMRLFELIKIFFKPHLLMKILL